VPKRKPVKHRDPNAPVGNVIRWDAPDTYAITFDDGLVELNPKPSRPARKKASKNNANASREGKRERPPVVPVSRPSGGDPGGDSSGALPSPTTSPAKRKPRLHPIKKKPKPPTADRKNKRGRADIKGQSKLSRFFVAKPPCNGPRTKLDVANSQLDNVHAIVSRIDDPLEEMPGEL